MPKDTPLKSSNRFGGELDSEIFRRVDRVESRVDMHGKNIDALIANDKMHDSRLDKLEHQNLNMALKIDHVEAHTKQIPRIYDSINTLHDTVNLALSSKSAAPAKARTNFWDKLPIQAWIAIAAGISGAIVFLLTGEIINFGG